jgi:hypothetical protein
MVFTIFAEAGLRYRNESTVRIGGLKVGLFSRIVNHEAEVFIPGDLAREWVAGKIQRYPRFAAIDRDVGRVVVHELRAVDHP